MGNDACRAGKLADAFEFSATASSRVLIALAAALHVTEDYVLSEDELALEGVEFRKKAGASSREEAALEARAIHMLERYLAIEDQLQMRSIDWEQARSVPHPVADIRDAEDAARSVREDGGWETIRSRSSPNS